MPSRAIPTSVRPTLTLYRLPSARWASRTMHLAGTPRSTAATTVGQRARVVPERDSTLFEGIKRIEYPVAPSMVMVDPSGNRGPFARVAREKSYSSCMSGPRLASGVGMSFALRGAPCGDDSRRLRIALRRYHDQQATLVRPSQCDLAWLLVRVLHIHHAHASRVLKDRSCLDERDPSSADVEAFLRGIPSVCGHTDDDTGGCLSDDCPRLVSFVGYVRNT
jgi:hypothetical protein